MKTAVSIPNELFEDAEKLARKMKTTRSGLYTRALSSFVSQHQEESMTEQMNVVMESLVEEEYHFTHATSKKNLRNLEW